MPHIKNGKTVRVYGARANLKHHWELEMDRITLVRVCLSLWCGMCSALWYCTRSCPCDPCVDPMSTNKIFKCKWWLRGFYAPWRTVSIVGPDSLALQEQAQKQE